MRVCRCISKSNHPDRNPTLLKLFIIRFWWTILKKIISGMILPHVLCWGKSSPKSIKPHKQKPEKVSLKSQSHLVSTSVEFFLFYLTYFTQVLSAQG